MPKQRQRVPSEYPQGRRVHVLAASEPYAAAPARRWQAFERTLTADDLLASLPALPAAAVPPVVVLDNASIPISKAFQAPRQALARQGAPWTTCRHTARN